MIAGLQIRRVLTAADGAAVLEIDGLTFKDCRRSPTEIAALDSEAYPIFVGWLDGKPVGYLCMMRVKTLHYDAFWVDLVAVTPACRNQGIAKALIAHGVQLAQAQGAEFVSALVRSGNGSSLSALSSSGFNGGPEGFTLMVRDASEKE